MGRVYLANDLRNGRAVAVKVLRPEFTVDRSTLRRFIAEARTVSQLGHPNIVRVEEFIETSADGGPVFYVMEYLTGTDLKRELAKGPMHFPRAIKIGLQLCDALEAVHGAGVIHRDIKPANIFLINHQGTDDFVKILDFGVAKLESTDGTLTTTTGRPLGTPAYMSPEQAAGEKVDPRSDLYSLGVVLYEMFTGRRPFQAASFGAYVVQHMTTRPLKPSELAHPGAPISEEMDRTILRCLEKEPQARYPNVRDLAADLRRLQPSKTVLRTGPLQMLRRGPGPGLYRLVGLPVLGGLVAVGIYALMGSSQQTDAENRYRPPPPLAAHASNPAVSPPDAGPMVRIVAVRSLPAGARVFLGRSSKALLGVTPCGVEVARGRGRVLVLRKPGYLPVERPLPADGPAAVEVRLVEASKPLPGPAGVPTPARAGPGKPPPSRSNKTRPGPVRKKKGRLDHLTLDPF